ncbi:rRNA maturation RNase YbeY [Candidatus Parcubacteria bacterium]|nr:rRNA maturation RNase YbeY [Patescibacteria group bacterium]MCG2694252.1 rRNA maturation RNase YbeY [Candidatus Parcubacteria bacterium]
MINLDVNGGVRGLSEELKKLEKAFFKEFKKDGNISIAFVDGATSKKLNKTYRGKNKPANILTFVYNDDDSLGEIILCKDELKYFATENNISIKKAAAYLIIHGVCHIFGFTHKINKKALQMEKIEMKIRKMIKI